MCAYICRISFDRQRLDDTTARLSQIKKSLGMLERSKQGALKEKEYIQSRIAGFDEEIESFQQNVNEAKVSLEERGAELIACKKKLDEWNARFEDVSRAISKKVDSIHLCIYNSLSFRNHKLKYLLVIV